LINWKTNPIFQNKINVLISDQENDVSRNCGLAEPLKNKISRDSHREQPQKKLAIDLWSEDLNLYDLRITWRGPPQQGFSRKIIQQPYPRLTLALGHLCVDEKNNIS
jgi:hypothetical protein